MAKRKNKKEDLIPIYNSFDIENVYDKELEENPKYSLTVDPENKYRFSEDQKKFIESYVQYKNINMASTLAGIDTDTANAYITSYNIQQEIRRINMALYHRQFRARLLTLDELGGYLTSLLVDYNVPVVDQIRNSDKLKIVQMIMDLNKMKFEAFNDPKRFMSSDIEAEFKELSVDTLKELISQKNSKEKEKNKLIEEIGNELSPEESAYLSTLSIKELVQMIENTKKGKKNEN